MDKEFLLTYRIKDSHTDFEWFDSEEELLDRVEYLGDTIEDIDAVEIRVVKQIIEA